MKQYCERNKDAKLVMRKLHCQQNKEYTKIYRSLLKNCARKCYAKNRTSICASIRRRYNLAGPKPYVRQQYVLTAKKALLHNNNVMKEVINYFMSQQEGAFEKMNKLSRMATIAQVAAHRLIAKALQIHKQYVGLLLKTMKCVWVTYQRAV